MILPSITLTLIGFATYSRSMRASMLDVMTSDYVRTAPSKGMSNKRVTGRHGVGNALIPVVTVVAIDFGLCSVAPSSPRPSTAGRDGPALRRSAHRKGPAGVARLRMVTAIWVIIFNLIADIIYAQLDPRIRL